MPFYFLSVSERKSAGPADESNDVWSVAVQPTGASIQLAPHTCILYGHTPAGTSAQPARKLESYQLYYVGLDAFPKGPNLLGYRAEFCIKPGARGQSTVHAVVWDEKSGQWGYEICQKPR